jgi:capsular exopolysaccharide synthesis family protein
VSKIYDALRRAERGKKDSKSGKKKRGAKAVPDTKIHDLKLLSLDENFRRSLVTLRNSIDSEMKQTASRIIMFTSAVQGEGKTTIAASLGRVLAIGETEKILLVDLAVTDPQLHELFGVTNEKGIVEYLAGKAELKDVVHSLDQGVLDLIPAGLFKSGEMAQPLFNSERMAQFIDAVADEYDYVLIDAPAILEVPETAIIGSYVGGVVMVIHSGKTRREVVKRAIQMVEKLDGKLIGTILNKKKYYIPEFIYRRV